MYQPEQSNSRSNNFYQTRNNIGLTSHVKNNIRIHIINLQTDGT